jgi:hypothetical protein
MTAHPVGVGKLEVAPTALAFGAVVVGTEAFQTLTATNVGEGPLVLSLGLPMGDAGLLYAVQPTESVTLAAGQSEAIVVRYAPSQTSPEDDADLVLSWGTSESIEIKLSGSVVAAPCVYTITPSTLNLSQVRPGLSGAARFNIEDLGPGNCQVTNLGFGQGTDTAFSLPQGPVALQQLSAPGWGGPCPSSMQVSVLFNPQWPGAYSGVVQFSIGGTGTTRETVELLGVGATMACPLVMPAELDFGVVAVGTCTSGKKKFVVVNACDSEATITSVALVGGGPFFLIDTPTLPAVVPQGATSQPFVVGFKPMEVGTYEASVLVYTDAQTLPFGVGFTGSAVGGTVQQDRLIRTFVFGPMSSYTFWLGDPGGSTIEVTDVSVNDSSLPVLDWSYDAVANSVTIDEKFVTLFSGDVIAITTTATYELTCN